MPRPFANDREFHKLLEGECAVELVTLLLELADDAYPDIDRMAVFAELDRLGRAAAARVATLPPGEDGLRHQLEAISRLLYVEEGFHGNERDYYDPRNSYLHEVLRRRTGIPITLAVVYLTVAAHAGIELHGVPAPAHFVLACDTPTGTLYVDPFFSGEVLTPTACKRRIQRMAGQPLSPSAECFGRARVPEIVVRVLRNLKVAYVKRNEWAKALPVQQRLSLLIPHNATEQRDLGLVYLRSGRPQPALRLLEAYAGTCDDEQASELEPFIRAARRLVAELN